MIDKIKKGIKIEVTNNSIFEMMGFQKVSGTVFTVRQDNSGCSIQCDQTGAIETVDFDDGEIQIL